MKVQRILIVIAFCLVALGLGSSVLAATSRPNVLFILTEDQGAHLGFLGTPGLQTPHIDALARSSVYFRNAFVAYPVCSASKAAMYTGMHNHTNGILNNTYNYHKPDAQVTAAERQARLWQTNRIREPYLTLIEILHANGYYQGVSHKLHVLPNSKFPYDEFLHGGRQEIRGFLQRATKVDKPWFLLVNIPNSHRPYPNSDKSPIRVRPEDVQIPAYLPDTPVVRKDWAEYLAAIEQVDALVAETIEELDRSGQSQDTMVLFMSDHGPTFQHGKMTLYDLGLRVPLMVRLPGATEGLVSDSLVSELDLLPTLVDLLGSQGDSPLALPGCEATGQFPYRLDGKSFAPLLCGETTDSPREFVFAEISDRGPLPNDGMQERSVFDGRWKLVYREKVNTLWRQVNADSRDPKPWGNRTYNETFRVKEQFPQQYRILQEMDPQNLGGPVPSLELYDLREDPDEINNLANRPEFQLHQQRLLAALRDWAIQTEDESTELMSR